MSNPVTIFQNQTKMTISMDTGLDLTAGTNPKIIYQDPKGNKGQWTATVAATKLNYNAVAGDFAIAGIWQLQAFVTLGGLDSYGAIVQVNVLSSLK